MKKFVFNIAYFALFFGIFYLSGCSSLYIDSKDVTSYKNGIKIFQKSSKDIKLQVELAQEEIGTGAQSPLLFFISIQNLGSEKIMFDINNVRLQNNGMDIYPLTFDELRHEGINYYDAIYSFGFYNNSIKYADGFFGADVYRMYRYPLFLPNGVFITPGFYNYSIGRAAILNNINKMDAEKLIIANYLRKSSLEHNDSSSGFVVIPFDRLKQGNLILIITINKNIYKIPFVLTKKAKNE